MQSGLSANLINYLGKIQYRFDNLVSIASLFEKLAEIKFPEETNWIPQEIRQDKHFKEYPHESPEKIFQSFGIHDFRLPLKENSGSLDEVVIDLCEKIKSNLDTAYLELYESNNVNSSEIRSVLKSFYLMLSNELFRNQIKLVLIDNLYSENKTIKYNKNSSIFKVYADLKNKLKIFNYNLPDLESTQEFKDFSKRNNNFTLVFSTKINDLAGISSRGIRSCQSLFDKCENLPEIESLNRPIIGTILSKYVGVCYVTSGSDFKGRGEKMLYRALVRQVFDTKSEKPYILIDKLHPTMNDSIYKIMKEALQSYSSVPVISLNDITTSLNYYSPEEDEEFLSPFVKSYKDTAFGGNIKKLLEQIRSRFPSHRIEALKLLPQEYLEQLIHDNDVIIRRFIAETGIEKFQKQLVNDPDFLVRLAIVENTESQDILYKLLHDPDDGIRKVVANIINPIHLKELIHDDNEGVRYIVAKKIPKQFLSEMLKDPMPSIREMATSRL